MRVGSRLAALVGAMGLFFVFAGLNRGSGEEVLLPVDSGGMGKGFNSKTQMYRDKCVKIKNSYSQAHQGLDVKSGGQFRLKLVTTRAEARQALGLPASAALGVGSFGIDPRNQLVDRIEFSALSSWAVIFLEVVDEEFRGEYELENDVWALLSRGKNNDFLKRCGDQFVYAVRKGAAVHALVKFEAPSFKTKRIFESSIKVFLTGGNIPESLVQWLDENGIGAQSWLLEKDQSSELPFDQLVDYLKMFPAYFKRGGIASRILGYRSTPYTNLTDRPRVSFHPFTWRAKNPISLKQEQMYLEELGLTLDQALEARLLFSKVDMNSADYVVDSLKFEKSQMRIRTLISGILNHAVNCTQHSFVSCQYGKSLMMAPNLYMPIERPSY